LAVVLPGDYNHDGTVDAADYVVWRKNDGSPGGYNTWRANFGMTFGSGSTTSILQSSTGVPEPSTFVLILLAAALRARCART